MNRHFSTVGVLIGGALALGGCTTLPTQQLEKGEDPVITGPATRPNYTPMEPALACLANTLREHNAPVPGIAVGDVKDYTGKFSQTEGNTITQGGALMVYSALGKLGDSVRLQERFDTRIAELELAYADRRQLGDGNAHQVEAGKPPVPWMPYFGGSILKSNYYIVGGITEVNYNISSGGFEAGVNGTSIKGRRFTMNVGVDLRIVDTRTLLVVKTVSLQKQLVGEEVGADVFRFFGNNLWDIDAGSKKQEPVQLGVRAAMEHGVVELVAAVEGVDPSPCLGLVPGMGERAKQAAKPAQHKTASAPAKAAPAAPAPTPAMPTEAPAGTLPPQNVTGSSTGEQVIAFDVASGTLPTSATGAVEAIAKQAAPAAITVQLLAREAEQLPPSKQDQLTDERVKALRDALAAKGINPARVNVGWRAARNDANLRRYPGGYVVVATVVIAP